MKKSVYIGQARSGGIVISLVTRGDTYLTISQVRELKIDVLSLEDFHMADFTKFYGGL